MRSLRAVVVALFVCGCAASPSPPIGSPADLPLGRPDAVLKAHVLEAIGAAATASPLPAWYQHLHMLGGLPDVAVEGGVLYVTTELPDSRTGRDTAESVCLGLLGELELEGLAEATVSHVAVTNLSNTTLAECLPEEAGGEPPT